MAFNDVTGGRQGKATACRIARDGNILRQEPDLADKVLVCRNNVYDRSREWISRFRRSRAESIVDR